MTTRADSVARILEHVRRGGIATRGAIKALILTGSATGSSQPDSDVDLLVITDGARWSRLKRFHEDVPLDIFVHGDARLLDELTTGTTDSLVRMYAKGVFLSGDAILTNSRIELAKSRLLAQRPLSNADKFALTEHVQSIARKAKRETDLQRRRFLVGMLGTHMLQAALHFRARWAPDPAHAIEALSEADPTCCTYFIEMYEHPTNDAIDAAVSVCLGEETFDS